MLAGNADFVQNNPIATKRVVRAILKAADLCVSEPQRVARQIVDDGFTANYDYALQTMTDVPYNKWREYDPEDTIRFYALRLQEAGMIRSSPAEDHRKRHRLAVPQRAKARAEDVSRPGRRAFCCWRCLPRRRMRMTRRMTNGCRSIGPAPDFTLTSQDGAPVSLRDFRGKVVAIAFIYTSCTDVCPMLTANMAQRAGEAGLARSGQRSPSFRSPSTRSATHPRC